MAAGKLLWEMQIQMLTQIKSNNEQIQMKKNTEHDSSDNDSDDGSRDELAAGKLLWEIQVCLLAF